MIKFSFYLDKPHKSETIVMMNVSCKGFRLQVSTGFTAKTKDWSHDKQAFKPSTSLGSDYNFLLKKLTDDIQKFYVEQNVLGNKIEKQDLKKAIDRIKKPEKTKKQDTFFDLWDQYVKDHSQDRDLKIRTVWSYNTTRKHLLGFQDKIKKNIEIENFNDEKFCNDYRHFLNVECRGKDKDGNLIGISNITLQGNFKNVKCFLNHCFEKNLIKKHDYVKYLKAGRNNGLTDAQTIALTRDELSTLEGLELETVRLRAVRDMFILQCFTGIRYSDLENLKPENINLAEGVIKINQIKTAESLIIPILENIRPMLEKYSNGLPVISNQKYNQYLKELCKAAGFNSPIQVVSYFGNRRHEETKFKYELIGTHTARRTFITLSLKFGILPEMVMQISGHKSRASFQKYVRISQDESLQEFRNKFKM